MKRWMIITLSILLLAFLVVRGIRYQFQNSKEERKWYVSQLNFGFSAEIDSVKPRGKMHRLLFFHMTSGAVERKLNKKLKHNTNMSLVLYPANKPAIILNTDQNYERGDSLIVDTRQNRIAIYRKSIKISESDVIASLNGRPF